MPLSSMKIVMEDEVLLPFSSKAWFNFQSTYTQSKVMGAVPQLFSDAPLSADPVAREGNREYEEQHPTESTMAMNNSAIASVRTG